MDDYLKDFIDLNHWIAFHYQISEILKCNPKTSLIIGRGLGIVGNYIKRCGIEVKTVDIDTRYKPDILCDIRALNEIEQLHEMDVVLCAEVLEHVPFKDFNKCIKNIYNLTKKFALITLPYNGIIFSVKFDLPLFHNKILNVYMPYKKNLIRHQHFWEIDNKKDTTLNSIRDKLNKIFKIEYDYRYPCFPYIHFFKLKK